MQLRTKETVTASSIGFGHALHKRQRVVLYVIPHFRTWMGYITLNKDRFSNNSIEISTLITWLLFLLSVKQRETRGWLRS